MASNVDWERVAHWVRLRRTELHLTQDDVVDRAGGALTKSVVSLIERAGQTGYRRRSLNGLCDALGWSHDSIDRILANKEPVEILRNPPSIEVTALRTLHDRYERLSEDQRRYIDGLIDGMLQGGG